jgi:predicted metal-dependent phosphoesterase TrpH
MEVKGIIHCHSQYSYDAKLSLGELKRLLLKQGLRFVCMTEHTDEMTEESAREFVSECERLSDDSFCFIPGFEVPYKDAHILMIGQRNFHSSYAENLTTLTQWSQEARFVVLAHPVRNKFIVEEGLLEQLDAIEVWNQQYEGKIVPRVRSLELFRRLKILKQGLLATGGVDLHRKEHVGTPTTSLDVSVLREEEILKKMSLGAYKVSSNKISFYGTLPNVEEVSKASWITSFFSVTIINCGKWVNKILAGVGISLPSSLKQRIRKRV